MGDGTRGAIPEALAEHGPATGPELARLLDVHPVTAERRLSALQQEGRIRQMTGGRYTLAERERSVRQVASD